MQENELQGYIELLEELNIQDKFINQLEESQESEQDFIFD
jgi:hypothetical protein